MHARRTIAVLAAAAAAALSLAGCSAAAPDESRLDRGRRRHASP